MQGGQDENLAEGWTESSMMEPQTSVNNDTQEEKDELTGVCWEERKEMLRNKWKETNYSLVMNKVDLMDRWPESNNSLKDALLSWMVENKEKILIEE